MESASDRWHFAILSPPFLHPVSSPCPQVAAGPGSAAAPPAPVKPLASRDLMPLARTLLQVLRKLDSRRQLHRQLRRDTIFWAARGKRPEAVYYWDVGVPTAGMTSATMRRFLGLPRKRQLEWEERIDNGNTEENDEELKAADTVELEEDNEGEETLPVVRETRPSESDKRDFWGSRGKKNGEDDFWASRGKKNRDSADFWASRGRRRGPIRDFAADRVSTRPFPKSSRERFWGSPGTHGKWAE